MANLGDQFHLSNLHLVAIWFGAVGVSALLWLFQRTRKWLPVFFAVLAILDAVLTVRLSQEFTSDGRWARSLLDRVDSGHKTQLTLNSLRRELEAPVVLGGKDQNNNVPLRIATFYNDSTMPESRS